MTVVPENLPGADLVRSGLGALRRGELTVEALLVLVGARRLRAAGVEVPAHSGVEVPEFALYDALAAVHGDEAHSRYNALIRRLVSLESALEHQAAHPGRDGGPSNPADPEVSRSGSPLHSGD